MKICNQLENILTHEMPDLNREISVHKWILSEKAGYDIGIDFAKTDYISKHLKPYAKGYRDSYCHNACKEECEYRK